ncbi:inositol polyphosphate 1-phosphatase isoform X3 [Penaeus vannamei]|uniref:inositol polyphosphate 1-phosphatase isoform X3 n=1 Tax=Penaeus vannamei TaxID=6689 RepID=UPI00387F7C7A
MDTMVKMELIETLLSFSEKAGEIARTIRREPKLFSLLVEEKGEEEKNQRFTQDFKTLADVLIQEALRHHVTQMIPSLGEHVHGEESAEFTNTLGERVIVQICATKEETATLLEKVLDGNREAADLLAAVVHTAIIVKPDSTLAAKIPKIPLDNLGIWIDPIDSTGEYVRGEIGKLSGSIYSSGLPSVTILIGFYDRFTGEIIGGVVNHPFAVYDEENQSWHGEVYWSVNYNDVKVHNMQIHKLASDATRPVIVMSSSEDVKVQEMLGKKFDIVYASGAGYKLLVVALGQVVAYVCSKSSTFRWDTAAPHGLLQALGGGVVVYRQLLSSAEDNHVSEDMLKNIQIKYNKPNADSPKASLQWSNAGGIVAYRDNKVLPTILECLRNS